MTQTATLPDYAAMSKAELIEVIETQKAVINTQRADLAWFTNSDLPIAARFAGYAAKKFTEERKPGEDGRFKAYLPEMGNQAGVSASTISRGIQTLADATDALEKHTLEEWDEEGKHSTLYIKPLDLFSRPAEVKPIKEIKKHGGDHRIEFCKGCGSERIVEKKTWVCTDCGQVHKTFEPRPVNTPLQDATTLESSEETCDNPEPLQLATLTVDTLPSDCNAMPPHWLRRKKIWVVWRYEPDKNGKQTKVPYNPLTGSKAESDNVTTWGTYEQVQTRLERSRAWAQPYSGIGFMCDGSFVGIDVDHCRNKETGEITAWAQAIIDRFPTWGYVTPSKEGFRLVIHAKKPGPRCKKGNVEIYEEKRFFTWTPEQLPGTPDEIVNCQAELDAFYAEVFPTPEKSDKIVNLTNLPCSNSDETILEKASNARNGAKFTRLWRGDTSGYATLSEADLALCEFLSYWGAGGDVFTIDRLYRKSGLYREDKWDRAARSGETYGEGTIARAIQMAGWQASA